MSYIVMKTNLVMYLCGIAFLTLQTFTARAEPQMDADTDATNEFSAVGNAVVELLKSRDTGRFAAEMAPTADDFRAVLPQDSLNNPDAVTSHANQVVKSTAEALLERADSLHLNFSNSNLFARIIPPEFRARIIFGGNPNDENAGAPYVRKLEVVLAPNANAAPSPNGDFKIAVIGLIKFPSGWKANGGVQWADFPSSVAGEKIRHELAILQKVNDQQGITAGDDPALLQLANAVVRFIRTQNIHDYQKDALANGDDMFAFIQKLVKSQGQGQRKLIRDDFFQNWNPQQQDWLSSAESALNFMNNSGIDMTDAQIQVTGATVERLRPPPMDTGSGMDGLDGQQFQIRFTVHSSGKSKNGTSLTGDYILSADEIMRMNGDWKVMGDLRWNKMPDGVLDSKSEAQLELESYLATHKTLPPGIMAPDIEFTRLDNGQKMKLSDLRGKVVVLDFWATWCGPCQEPMAHLQMLREQNPDWEERVAIVPLSIDDTIDVLRNRIDTRGWTNTFNVWAGKGGFDSAPALTFHLKGVPATYIIDAQGKIVTAGHPAGMDIDGEVNTLLNPTKQ